MSNNLQRLQALVRDPLATGPALSAARRIFGNNAVFKQNLQGGKELWQARRHRKSGNDALITAMDRDGVVHVPNTYDPDMMAQVVREYEASITNDGLIDSNPARNNLDYRRMIADVIPVMPSIGKLVDAHINSLLHSFFGGEYRMISAMAYRNYHVPPDVTAKEEIITENWHNDSGNTAQMSLYVLLSDVEDADGPMHVLDCRRTRKMMKAGYRGRNDYRDAAKIIEEPGTAITFTGPAGSTYFCSVWRCLHRAGVPEPGHHRDMAILTFCGAASSMADDRSV
jgi:hypothetical protein